MSTTFALIRALALFSLLATSTTYAGQLSCLDEQGKPVDWYIGYKFPKINQAREPNFETGYTYSYFTNQDAAQAGSGKSKTSLDQPVAESALSLFLHRFRNLLSRFVGEPPARNHVGEQRRSSPRLMSNSIRNNNDYNNNYNNDNYNPRWELSKLQITDQDSALLRTVKQAYQDKYSALLYNDDTGETKKSPDSEDEDADSQSIGSGDQSSASTGQEEANRKDSSKKRRRDTKKSNNLNRAHAKGVVVLDQEGDRGIWVTHSIPRFPAKFEHELVFPESAQRFGQTFMCITFGLSKTGPNIIEHLLTMNPQVYDTRFDEKILEEFPRLKGLIPSMRNGGRRSKGDEPKLSQTVMTSGGEIFNIFAKSKDFAKDLYAGWIDEELGAALYVETWRRGSGNPLNSSCPQNDYHINNVVDLKYDEKTSWSYLKDHSKWAISEEEEHSTFCIGDSNRMESQFKRGGGAACFKCPHCWKVFSNTILDVEPCPVPKDKLEKRRSDVDKSLLSRIAKFFQLDR